MIPNSTSVSGYGMSYLPGYQAPVSSSFTATTSSSAPGLDMFSSSVLPAGNNVTGTGFPAANNDAATTLSNIQSLMGMMLQALTQMFGANSSAPAATGQPLQAVGNTAPALAPASTDPGQSGETPAQTKEQASAPPATPPAEKKPTKKTTKTKKKPKAKHSTKKTDKTPPKKEPETPPAPKPSDLIEVKTPYGTGYRRRDGKGLTMV